MALTDSCSRCGGIGRRIYGSGSTWRGGMGTAMCVWDLCDLCWGSGDEQQPFTNVRKLEAKLKDQDLVSGQWYVANALGSHLPRVRLRIEQLAELAYAQARKRKLPEGEYPGSWCSEWHALAGLLERLAREPP